MMTPGFRSSEFWLSVASMVVGAILAAGLPDDSIVMRVAAMAAVALNALGYTVARTSAKRAIFQSRAQAVAAVAAPASSTVVSVATTPEVR